TDAVVVEVIDTEPVSVASGAGGRGGAVPGGTSFIIPTSVYATSGVTGAVFTSDGWLRNQSGTAASADLYYTPDGKDGLNDSTVRKATVSIPAGNTVRLSNLLNGVFQQTGT